MKIFDKKVKMPKDAIWLVPGLKVKRWFALSIMGSVLAFLGLTFLFKLEPLDYIVKFAKEASAAILVEAAALAVVIGHTFPIFFKFIFISIFISYFIIIFF